MRSSNRSTLVSDAGLSEGRQAEGWQGVQGSAHGDFVGRREAAHELNGSDHTVAVLAQAIQHALRVIATHKLAMGRTLRALPAFGLSALA